MNLAMGAYLRASRLAEQAQFTARKGKGGTASAYRESLPAFPLPFNGFQAFVLDKAEALPSEFKEEADESASAITKTTTEVERMGIRDGLAFLPLVGKNLAFLLSWEGFFYKVGLEHGAAS